MITSVHCRKGVKLILIHKSSMHTLIINMFNFDKKYGELMEILMTFERRYNKILGNNIFITYGLKLNRLLT